VHIFRDITAERAQLEQRYRTIFDYAGDAIFIFDLEGRFLDVNKIACERLGYSREELMNMQVQDIIPRELAKKVPQRIKQVQDKGCAILETPHVRRDGMVIPVEVNCRTIDYDGIPAILATARDITERKKAQQALRRSEEKYRRIVETSNEGIWMVDPEARTVFVNRRMAEMLGYEPEEMVGKKSTDFQAEQDREFLRQQLKQRKQGIAGNYDIRFLRKDGSTFCGLASAVPVYHRGGTFAGSFGMVIDITERKKAEQIKEEFISLVSHEMKTPLTVMLGGLHTLLHDGGNLPEEDRAALLRDAYLETESLADIVENLLELSRAQANRIVLRSESVVLEELLHEAVGKAMLQHGTRRVSIEVPPGMPVVKADKTRLERILHNLLDNAFKYSPQQSAVRVFAINNGEELTVGVSDQGQGMCREDQAKLFQPFERLGQDTAGKSGTGIGLVVCKRLVQAHGGRIWIESEPGKGSTFYFSLPVKQETPGLQRDRDNAAGFEGRRAPDL